MNIEKVYDVLVVGGGIAGIAAALEAARSGLHTALVEKTILWGGLATSGLVPVYMPLCDGGGRQVTFGIAEELLEWSIKYGPGHIPAGWLDEKQEEYDTRFKNLYTQGKLDIRYATIFSPVAFAWGLDEVLYESGVDLWLDTLACQPMMVGNRVTGVEVENKSGRIAIRASCVVDTSGDADIAYRAGAPCEEQGSFPSYLGQYTSLALAREAVADNSAERLVTYHNAGANEFGQDYPEGARKYAATSGKDVTQFIMESRRVAREKMGAQQRLGGDTSRENMYPASLPTMAQFRMTRRIAGHETVYAKQRNQYCENSIGIIADCRQTDALWEVPYGSLVPQKVENLLVAGRCTSAEGHAWQVTRLIPAAALSGQIAAIAAALAIRDKTSPDRLAIKDIQKAAEDRGFVLHI
jgi:succinate dehydrogenase/fumarate reductase flavoprotein subunit